jgi:hypothetical protein
MATRLNAVKNCPSPLGSCTKRHESFRHRVQPLANAVVFMVCLEFTAITSVTRPPYYRARLAGDCQAHVAEMLTVSVTDRRWLFQLRAPVAAGICAMSSGQLSGISRTCSPLLGPPLASRRTRGVGFAGTCSPRSLQAKPAAACALGSPRLHLFRRDCPVAPLDPTLDHQQSGKDPVNPLAAHPVPGAIDVTKPHPARMYDYLPGRQGPLAGRPGGCGEDPGRRPRSSRRVPGHPRLPAPRGDLPGPGQGNGRC